MSAQRLLLRLMIIAGISAGFAIAEDKQELENRVREIQSEQRHIDSLISAQNALSSRLTSQQDSMRRAVKEADRQQTTKLHEISLRLMDTDRRIAEKRAQINEASSRRNQVAADSVAVVARADRGIDSLGKALRGQMASIMEEKNTIAGLQTELAALNSEKAGKEADRRATAERSRTAISRFDESIAKGKEALRAAQARLAQARNDSVAATGKSAAEMGKLRDSLSAAEKSIAALKHASDSLSQALNALQRDSTAAWKTNNDSLRTAAKRLDDFRKTIADKDSAVSRGTDDLIALRNDSSVARTQFMADTLMRSQDIKALDSLIVDVQNKKTVLLRMQEKLQLDSAIEQLSGQLREFLKKSADERSQAIGPDAEKSQMLDAYLGKREIIVHEDAIAAMIAGAGDTTAQEWNRRTGEELGHTQQRLDSAFAAREKTVRDGVLMQQQLQQLMKDLAGQKSKLATLITQTSRDLVNAKARLAKMEQDSAAALRRRESADSAFAKRIISFSESITLRAVQADSLVRACDTVKSAIEAKRIAGEKQLIESHASVGWAGDEVHVAQGALDSVSALQQNARKDSISADNEKSGLVMQVQRNLDIKQEEIKLKNGRLEVFGAQLAKTRADSGMLVSNKNSRLEAYHQMIRDLERRIQEGKAAGAGLDHERSTASADSASAVQGQAGGSPSSAQQISEIQVRIAEIDKQVNQLREQRNALEKERIDASLSLERAERAAPAAPPAPAKQAAASPAPAQPQQPASPNPAQTALMRIYDYLDQGKNADARKTYSANQRVLKKGLDPEAFNTIRATIESLETPLSPDTHAAGPAPAIAASPPPSAPSAAAAPPLAPASAPVPAAKPPAPAPTPVSEPPPPAPMPEIPQKEATIFITSLPPVAMAYMDGEPVGKTNIGYLKVMSGKHLMQFMKGDLTCTREMTFIEGINPTQIVKLPCQ
jgi:hypothetical protein